MKVVAAYLLLLLGGKAAPGPEDIRSILGSVGAEVDDDKLDLFFKELGGKDVNEVLALGRERFAAGGGGGGGIAVAAASSGGGGGGAAAPAAEEEKEEKKEEKEESDDDMGFSLFD
ncbi:hypothetical protein GOP47_0022752 [Adiantum capillus-veneris]|uniref:Uncharacterized protein n=1 Tax=Adiantum capillus-veneris TaxID=13818 RepID=A0A9D4Z4K8_ADICA|nr:hypothetical protein GOP47_0022752 [Adiantum capillus-veneris]